MGDGAGIRHWYCVVTGLATSGRKIEECLIIQCEHPVLWLCEARQTAPAGDLKLMFFTEIPSPVAVSAFSLGLREVVSSDNV